MPFTSRHHRQNRSNQAITLPNSGDDHAQNKTMINTPTHPLDPEGAHDVRNLVAPDPMPSPADQPTMGFPIPVHRHEPVRVDHHDVTGRRRMGEHAACWRHGL